MTLDPGRAGSRDLPGRVVVLLVGLVVAGPVLAVLWHTVMADGAFDTEAFGRVLGSPRTWRLLALTIGQAVASCAVTLLVGVPVAWVLQRFSFPGRAAVRSVATIPFVLPTVVVGAAMASLLGPRGLVDLRGSWWPILAAHLCFNLAVVLRTVGSAFSAVPADLEPAARLLGCSRVGAARRVLLPVVAPSITAAAVVVFLFCLTSFGVVVILGGGRVSTIEVEIWTRATRQFDLSGAGVLCLLQLVAVVATLAVHARVTKGRRGSGTATGGRRVRPEGIERLLVAAAVSAVVLVSLLPILAVVERSLRVGSGWGLQNWAQLGSVDPGSGLRVAPWYAVVVSIGTSLVATLVAVALAAAVIRAVAAHPGGFGDRLMLLPLGVSSTTIGLGLLLLVGRPPVDLRGSWWLVPLGQALVAMPLVVRVVLPAVRALPTSVLDAASLLGLDRRERWWRVELPMLRGALGAGAGLALVACLGEFGATAFLARGSRPTVPVAIERLMSRPAGSGFGQAMALSCVLVVICALVVLLVDRMLGDDEASLF